MNQTESAPVTQAVIASGGFGTRLGEALNPKRCKSLIEYKGQSMLGWLIDALIAGGIEDFVVATNNHCDAAVREILETKHLSDAAVLTTPSGLRTVPYQARHLLQARSLFACAHHPLTSGHVARLRTAAESYQNVISAYRPDVYPPGKEHAIVTDEIITEPPSFSYQNPSTGLDLKNRMYVRNPYVFSRDIADKTKADDFKYTFSRYLYQDWVDGTSLGVVEADMPPEFDYPEQYEQTKQFLGTLATGSSRC